jgi:hypothetical protein
VVDSLNLFLLVDNPPQIQHEVNFHVLYKIHFDDPNCQFIDNLIDNFIDFLFLVFFVLLFFIELIVFVEVLLDIDE